MAKPWFYEAQPNCGYWVRGDLPPSFVCIPSNEFVSRPPKPFRKSQSDVCVCAPPTSPGRRGCEDNCLNRHSMVECHRKTCPCGDACANQRFTRREYAKAIVSRAENKGWGLFAGEPIKRGQFVIEYCGEVINHREFQRRARSHEGQHFYFMSIGSDDVIDASQKGNQSRFINHSCEPNCETQKWLVHGELRIGLFAIKDIEEGTELTFDYQFERYGKKAQKCYCGAPSCRGVIGSSKRTSSGEHGDEDDGAVVDEVLLDDGGTRAKVQAMLEGREPMRADVLVQAMRGETDMRTQLMYLQALETVRRSADAGPDVDLRVLVALRMYLAQAATLLQADSAAGAASTTPAPADSEASSPSATAPGEPADRREADGSAAAAAAAGSNVSADERELALSVLDAGLRAVEVREAQFSQISQSNFASFLRDLSLPADTPLAARRDALLGRTNMKLSMLTIKRRDPSTLPPPPQPPPPSQAQQTAPSARSGLTPVTPVSSLSGTPGPSPYYATAARGTLPGLGTPNSAMRTLSSSGGGGTPGLTPQARPAEPPAPAPAAKKVKTMSYEEALALKRAQGAGGGKDEDAVALQLPSLDDMALGLDPSGAVAADTAADGAAAGRQPPSEERIADFRRRVEVTLSRLFKPLEDAGTISHRRFKETVLHLSHKVLEKEKTKAEHVAGLAAHVPRREPFKFDRAVEQRVKEMGEAYIRDHFRKDKGDD